jgi:hypothetical protein
MQFDHLRISLNNQTQRNYTRNQRKVRKLDQKAQSSPPIVKLRVDLKIKEAPTII